MSEAGVQETVNDAAPARSFVERLIGVLRLDAAAFDEIAADPAAMGQAAGVVAAAALANSLSAVGGPLGGQGLAFIIQTAALWPLAGIAIWAIGHWFGHPAELARVLRVVGYAMAPLILGAAGAVPVEWLSIAAKLLSVALLIATFVTGTRHALRTSLGRAAFVCLVLFLIVMFTFMVFQYFISAPA